MKVNTFLKAVGIFWCFLGSRAGLTMESGQPTIDLKVEFTNVNPRKGQIYCNLFTNGEGFPGNTDRAIQSLSVEITDGNVSCNFGMVPPGTYAIAAIHDENENGKMDTNLIGIPREGWVVSNEAPPKLFGPPTFEDAAFQLEGSEGEKILGLNFRY